MTEPDAIPWPLVLAIVVTHNGRRWLPGCLKSLALQSYPALEVVVVDNDDLEGRIGLERKRFEASGKPATPVVGHDNRQDQGPGDCVRLGHAQQGPRGGLGRGGGGRMGGLLGMVCAR